MSFSISGPAKAESFDTDVETLVGDYVGANGPFNDGAAGLIEAGTEAAKAAKAALGDKAETYSVSISGHGNPGHGPAEGYGNESLGVHVSVTRYKEAEAEQA